MIFVDFFRDIIGLHVNGRATVLSNEQLLAAGPPQPVRDAAAVSGGLRPERWVQVVVHEAYIHCSKHIPVLEAKDRRIHWGTDDAKRKGGDFFRAREQDRPWVGAAADDAVLDLRDSVK